MQGLRKEVINEDGQLYSIIFMKESLRLPGKHLMEICGKPMVSRIYETLRSTGLFEDVIVFSKYREISLKKVNVVRDYSSGVLIDSIISAIDIYGEFLAVGGDMPCIRNDLVTRFVKEYHDVPIAALDVTGFPQPLFAIYNRTIVEELRRYSLTEKRIYPFLQQHFLLVELDERESAMLMSVNTEDDIILAEKCCD